MPRAVGAIVLAFALVLGTMAGAPAQGQTGKGAPAQAASPLAPVPTASPRQTLTSFRTLAQGAETALLEAIDTAATNDAIFDTPEVSALKQTALDDITKAASTLDLSAVAPENRRTVGISSVLLLKEIMDRVTVPPAADVPGSAAVAAGDVAHGWRVPGTELRLSRVEGADGEAHFLFSRDTVQRLPEFYARVRDLPRHTPGRIDFYQSFVLGPGLSMPVEFYRYVLELPSWMLAEYNEQAVWQWIAFVLLTALTIGAALLLMLWEGRRAQPVSPVRRSIRAMLVPLAMIALLAGFRWINDDFINLTGDVLAAVELIIVVLQALALAYAILLAFNAVAALLIAMPTIRKESLDASLIRLVLRVVGFVTAGYVLSMAAARIGVPLYGIIASLGVGGLALALAVRPTLENFIGGIILYADRPVRVGDFCQFGSMLGTVEAIGLRSTKVRGLDRTLVTVQNAEFAQMSITNFTRRDSNLMQATIALRYETSEQQLTAVIADIERMLAADERVDAETVRVCLRQFGDYSLDVEVRAYVLDADWTGFLKIQEELFLRIMQIVHENGTTFAFPSQTTYLGKDRPPAELFDDEGTPLRFSPVSTTETG